MTSETETFQGCPEEIAKNIGLAESGYALEGANDLSALQQSLGYFFKNLEWLERALTHRSVQPQGVRADYERLEFLGDAVLDLAVAQLLLDIHKDSREGDLSKMRAALVNAASLAEVARAMDLGRFIRMSRGEVAGGGAERPSLLADVLEAILGAIHRDSGYSEAFECVKRLMGSDLHTVTPRDPKTELQEALHARGEPTPEYLLDCVEGPEHAPIFVSVVKIFGETAGRGSGATKKASQQAAAAEALAKLQGRA